MNVRSSLNEALRRLLTRDERVILLGEDLHDPYGGAFKVTAGLSTAVPGRVISTPIGEAGLVGASIGLALAGYRPVAEIMFADFITLAMDQIYNHAVKFGMFDGVHVPLVVRTPSGGRRGYGPTHSQSPENLMTAVPGLTVVFPSHRHDVGHLLEIASLEWNAIRSCSSSTSCSMASPRTRPTTRCSAIRQPIPGRRCFRRSSGVSTDPDLTLVAYGGMLDIVERVAVALLAEDLAVEIVAPSLLQPLPRHTLLELLMDKSRIAIVEESPLGPGFGSELAATLLEHRFAGRVRRFGPPPVPIPAARSLESSILPDERRLFDALVSFITDESSQLMAVPLHTPRVNNNDDVVRLLRVLVKPGDAVGAGDIVAEVETDKASFTVEAEHPGLVLAVLPQVNDMIDVGSVLLWLGATPDDAVPEATAPADSGSVTLRPDGEGGSTARAVRADSQPDVPASDGRLSAQDVEEHVQRQRPAARSRPLSDPRPSRPGGRPAASGTSHALTPEERGMLRTVLWHRQEAVPGTWSCSTTLPRGIAVAADYQKRERLLLNPLLALMAYRLTTVAQGEPAADVHDRRRSAVWSTMPSTWASRCKARRRCIWRSSRTPRP